MLHPVIVSYAWGPLIFEELERVTKTEAKALADAGRLPGTDFIPAAMTFSGMYRMFRLALPADFTLPTSINRKRGDVVPFEYSPSLSTFFRLYQTFFHGSPEIISGFVGPLRRGDWDSALDFAFRNNGYGNDAAWRTTGHYARFENLIAGIAAGLGFMFGSEGDHPILHLTPEQVALVHTGNFSVLRGMAVKSKIQLGWMLAAFVALYCRGSAGTEARLALQSKPGPDGLAQLHELLWGLVPEFKDSEPFAMYEKMLRGGTIEPPKPGPKSTKKKAKTAAVEPASATVPQSADLDPSTERPAIPSTPPATAAPMQSKAAAILDSLNGSALTELAARAARKPDHVSPPA